MSSLRTTRNGTWLAVLILAAIGALGGCAGAEAQQGVAEAAPAAKESVPEQADPEETASYRGLPVGFTDEGYPYLGDPDAPLTIKEYSDFLCAFSGRHYSQTLPTLIEKYGSTGQVRYVFRDMPLVGLHPTAPIGHAAALCVAEQGAALYWAMHDELFGRQNEWNSLPDPTDFLVGAAEEIGADIAAYQACMASGRKEAQVEASATAGNALGLNSTPSFQFTRPESDESYTLAGAPPIDTFTQWLDALLAGETPPQEEQEEAEPGELPFWANNEGLVPDPERPGFTMAGDQYKGSPDAKLVVIEFTDFQCPACQRHALEIQPVLDEEFVETGQIMWVFKPLPLKEHPQAPVAAVAAECAADQGQFWDMYHLLFEELDQWSTDDDSDSALLALAKASDLDMDVFAVCFNSRQALERVLSDLYDAQGIVQTTPTFIVIYEGAGRVMRGSRPVDQFVPILQNMLEDANVRE